jgi:hypothetical protein
MSSGESLELNEKRSPDRITATSARPAFRLCLTEPIKHDPYRMSPLARGNWIGRGKLGCRSAVSV